MVSTRPPTSKFSRLFNNPLVIVPNAPITIGTIVTFMFHSFFSSLARSRYLSFFSLSFGFILWSDGTAKSTILQILFFLYCCWLLWGLVFWPGLGDSFVLLLLLLFWIRFSRLYTHQLIFASVCFSVHVFEVFLLLCSHFSLWEIADKNSSIVIIRGQLLSIFATSLFVLLLPSSVKTMLFSLLQLNTTFSI